jgi:hypothetical protein
MKKISVSCDSQGFKQAVKEYEDLLNSKQELEEKKDIQPFFKSHSVLITAMAGLADITIMDIDELEFEFDLWQALICDIGFGDSKTNSYCLIELEDATKDSIFKSAPKNYPKYSSRLECGLSQISDWLYQIDMMKNTASHIKQRFADDNPKISTILIIGRSEFLNDDSKRKRFEWRFKKTVIDSKKIICCTYDELLDYFKAIIQRREREDKLFDTE